MSARRRRMGNHTCAPKPGGGRIDRCGSRGVVMDDELHGWGPALDEIARRKADAYAMGGEARLVRQHERGRLNARERLSALFDPGTFFEIGNLVGIHRGAARPRRCPGSRLGPHRRSPGAGRRRGRDRARRVDRQRRLRQAVPPVPARRPGAGAAGHDARGRRPPGDRLAPAGAGPATSWAWPSCRAWSRWCAWCSGPRPGTAPSPPRCATSWP